MLAQRRAFNNSLNTRMAQPALKLAGAAADPDALEYRRVEVRGVYDPTQEILLRNRELERSHAALALSESRSRAIANNAADGILTLDENGLVETFNSAAERLFGFARTETVGEPAAMLLESPGG